MTGSASVSENAGGLRRNQTGEASFKIVAVSYRGAVDWVVSVSDRRRADCRGELRSVEHEGWRVIVFDFQLSGLRVEGHPARFYLCGNEGIGFIGQPGTAKDAVYEGAHVIVGIADAGDASYLVSVLDGDFDRMHSRGLRPACVLSVSPFGALPELRPSLAGAIQAPAWREQPLEVLKLAVKAALRKV